MSEREPRRLSDAELIELGLDAWENSDPHGIIDATTARMIASQEHAGQASGLYSFASTGAIDLSQIAPEFITSAREAIDAEDADRQRALEALSYYLHYKGNRGPVDNWHQNTTW